jgi:GH35 family endo-1,4-beta-xylanase
MKPPVCSLVLRLIAMWLACHGALSAAAPPDGGRDLLPKDWQDSATAQGGAGLWESVRREFPGKGPGWQVRVIDETAHPSRLQLTCRLSGEAKRGDRLLVAFDARCVPGSSADGLAQAKVVIEIKEAPKYPKLGTDTFQVGSDWSTVFIPFAADTDSKPGFTHVSILPGGRKQALEIANLRLLNYGADYDITKLPRPYIHYPGREADAAWRKEALERIDRHRTSGIRVEVVDAAGAPVSGASVSLVLKRHAFGFGSAVKAKFLMGPDPGAEKYREMVDANFSSLVLENDLKPFGWTGGLSNQSNSYRLDWTMRSLAWAKERGMKTRGHYLCWGPWEPWSTALKDNPAEIRAKVMGHLDEVIRGTGGLIDEWDAVNHPAGWNDPRATIDLAIGKEFYADVFRAARARTGVPLVINEDQVFRAGRQQEDFYQIVKDLLARGGRVDGIGNQGHFHSSHLPSPGEMLRISDRFAGLVPNLAITEFDVNTNGDEQLQADWLRDCLIMAYSHPAYSSFILWVFWEGTGYKPELALWRKDWSEKPNAKVWRDLVWNQWATRASGKTDGQGCFNSRGHRGLYDIMIEHAGQERVLPFHTERGTDTLRVVW